MKFAIQSGTFQPAIHAGRLNKAGTAFLDGKEDVTDMALHAVGAYVRDHFDGGLVADFNDFTLEVKVVPREAPAADA